MKPRLLFIVESGTDVRLVEGLAAHFDLKLIARRIHGGVEISQPPSMKIWTTLGPPGRFAFAKFVCSELIRRRHEIDVVLVQGYSLAALAANIARQFTDVPVIMLVCSPVEAYYKCRLTHPGGIPYRRHEARLLDALARINALLGENYVVLSEHLGDVVRRHGARRVHNIPVYGVDTSIFAPPPVSKQQLKTRLGLPSTGTLIFFSSRVAPEKDSETLLRAVRQLLDSGHDLWLLHRSGGFRQFLRDAEKFGVAERVIATDAVHPHRELPLDYQACDICVQASRQEGLGFSPLEALACETPVIATSVGGLRETILEGRTGWTYPLGDDRALAAAIHNVIQDPDEALRRARDGRRLVIEKFDRQLVFSRFAELARAIIEPGSRPRAVQPSEVPLAPFRSLKILLAAHVRRDEHTAVYRNTCQRAIYFESRGHKCTVLTLDDFPWIGKISHRLTPLLFPLGITNWLWRRKDDFDIAMFHSYAGWLVTLFRHYFDTFRSLRIAIMFHGLEPLYFERLQREVKLSLRYRLLHGRIMSALLKRTCREADLLMCLNSQEAQFLVDHRWSTEGKTKVVRNPAPDAYFQIDRDYQRPATRLLFVGQWLPMKGTRYLVEAFKDLRQRHPALHLCCAGTLVPEETVMASFPPEMRNSISVRSRVDHDELTRLHAEADIFVFPSLSEGSSLALVEAMASGLPIVATPVGAAPDVLRANESVLFVPPQDASSIVGSVDCLINDARLREKLGTAARESAERMHPSAVWGQYCECLNRLVGIDNRPQTASNAAAATMISR